MFRDLHQLHLLLLSLDHERILDVVCGAAVQRHWHNLHHNTALFSLLSFFYFLLEMSNMNFYTDIVQTQMSIDTDIASSDHAPHRGLKFFQIIILGLSYF